MADRDRDQRDVRDVKDPKHHPTKKPAGPPEITVNLYIRGQIFEVTSVGEPKVSIGGSGRIIGVEWAPKEPVKIGFLDWSAVDMMVWDAPPAPESDEPK